MALIRQARAAYRDGFTGKLAIHPDQVDALNDVFAPSAEAIADARRIVAAFAAAEGAGVISLDGRMLDQPHLARAKRVLALVSGDRGTRPAKEVGMAFLRKVDHVTYACAKGTIEKWAWFHIEVEGGTLINRIDDVRPDDPDSSMKIWCIDYGGFRDSARRGHRSTEEVAGHQVRRAPRRPLVPARRFRLLRSRGLPTPLHQDGRSSARPRRSFATTASGSSSRCSPKVTRKATRPRRASPNTWSGLDLATQRRSTITFSEQAGPRLLRADRECHRER